MLKFKRLLFAGLVLMVIRTVEAAPVIFSDRQSFLNTVGSSLTDDFSDYGAPIQLSDVQMRSVKGETIFQPISFPGTNLVTDYVLRPGDFAYCAGCNGNFKLLFDDTSLSSAGSVYGAALDVILHTSRRVSIGDDAPSNPTFPSEILVEFANGDTESIVVPADVGYYQAETFFVGLVDSRGIRSFTVGTEPFASRHFWLIDNLTIASQGTAIPEPGTLALLALGLAGLGYSRRKQ